MRRNYISPEYRYDKVFGTYNMLERSSFFGSKMLEIEDSVLISDQSILYYQKSNKEQIDISVENSLPSIVYSSSDDKLLNHKIEMDESQSNFQMEKNTKWILNVNLREILSNYIFATLKQYRTFEGVRNDMTIYNDVDFAINDYIDLNIINRYKFSKIELYVKYRDIKNQNLLRYKNDWNQNIISLDNLVKKIQTETAYDDSSVRIMFTQESPSDQFSFEYFFNITFSKI